MRLKGKAAVVTGGGSGMGAAIATLFAREGARVSVADIDPGKGQKVVDAINQSGGTAQLVVADVGKTKDIEKMLKATTDAYGSLDIIVNNAGVPISFMAVEDVSEELYERIMNVNLKAIYLTAKFGAPIMKKQGKGVMINVTSIAGVRPRPGFNVYSASKGGAIILTKALAIELAGSNIRVNSVSPVAADTPMLAKFIGEDKDYEQGRKNLIATIPLGRLAAPDDIAYAALYLASDEAALVTGINLEVDGGRGI